MQLENVDRLLVAVRRAASSTVWEAAEELERSGGVIHLDPQGDTVEGRVRSLRGDRVHEVYLWPEEARWECDCGIRAKVCVHVSAASLALRRVCEELPAGGPVESAAKVYVEVVYSLIQEGTNLRVERGLRHLDGREELLVGRLSGSALHARPADIQAETLLTCQRPGPLEPDALRQLLVLLGASALATLNGRPLKLSGEPLYFRIRVTDAEDGKFKVGLYSPAGCSAHFRGAAVRDGVLHPTSRGHLTPEKQDMLRKGTYFDASEVGRLVNQFLPALRGDRVADAERIAVEIETDRLPEPDGLRPRVLLQLAERESGLEVRADLVYGHPPVARLENGVLKQLGRTVPARDMAAERAVAREFEARIGLPIAFRKVMPPDLAATFLRDKLPLHDGPVSGDVSERRFQVVDAPVLPEIRVRSASDHAGEWELEVEFRGARGTASSTSVLTAWREGRTLVPLLEGGYAPLPADWLKEHGGLLRELLEARDSRGRVGRQSTAALVELLEDTRADVPPDLRRLRTFLENGLDLPEVPLPDGFVGELRPYQEGGFRWLRFLREVELNGVLADDMGLGKTIQALAAMLDAGGQHLVVAPTSVLRNWQRESERFTPGMKVNLYHGSGRKLDDSGLTLTSYALLRMDIEELKKREWTYAVLDEAQAIKNHDSQTARSARQLRARHRLALTGTPVENRLEELWSLLRYLMPGFLGSIEAFRERFVRPIESGSAIARDALRNRVRPYVLRRLKQQVARDLPALTDVVVRCEMGLEQRRIYELVRAAARDDIQRAIAERGEGGATMQVLEALLRMRQACCDPALLPGQVGTGADSCKLDHLEELLVDIVGGEHRVLIFSQWTSLLDLVEKRLLSLGVDWVRLDGTTRDRQAVIDRFQSPSGPPVFLLSLKAGGTGLNLTAADYVVHLDPWWNPAVQQQATDRAHRIGQDKPVVSYRLIVEGTVEERILDLQDAKRALADAALGTDGGFLRALSAEELRSLFEAA